MDNKPKLLKIIARYILIGIIGAIAAALGCSVFQIWKIKDTISKTDVLVSSDSADTALQKLLQIERWATRYPDLAVELNVAAIRCQVKRRDMKSAEDTARRIFDGKYSNSRISRSAGEFIQNIPNVIVKILCRNKNLNRFSGYEELVSSVRQSDSYHHIVEISKNIIALDPSSQLAQKVRAYIPDESVVVVAQNKPPSPQPTPQQDIPDIKNPGKAPEPVLSAEEILKKYVELKDWDNALKQCETMLKHLPSNSWLLEIQKLASARGMRWGLVRKSTAPAYDAAGKVLSNMPAGSMMEISEVIKSQAKGDLAVCTAAPGSSSPASSFRMRCYDLEIQVGDIRKLPADFQALLIREAQLAVGIVDLRAKLVAAYVDDKNPFAGEYKAAKQAYNAYWEKVRAIQKKIDSAPSEDRMQFTDELRQMKGEDIRLGTALDAAKKKYDQSARNAAVNIKSPALDAMQAELNTVTEKIRSIRK